MEKIIIDTDCALGCFGRDVDDGLAILLALNSPELEVVGVTVTHGNVGQRRAYRSAKRVLEFAGRADVPLLPGAFSRRNPERETDASRFIRERLAAHPGEITLLPIGPLTNLATAEKSAPGTLRAARRVVCMGGAVYGRGMLPPLINAEFNFLKDPAAAALVVERCGRLTLVPTDLTMRVVFGPEEMARIRKKGTETGVFLTKHITSWYLLMSVLLRQRGFCPHDPLAAAYLVRPEWYETQEERIRVRTDFRHGGEIVRTHEGSPVTVCTDVDKGKFLDFLLKKLLTDRRTGE